MDFTLDAGTSLLRCTPATLDGLLRGLADDWTMRDEGPGTWSPYQVVGHLAHLEDADWLARTRVLLRDDPDEQFEPIDREAGFERFAGWSLHELLDRFAAARHANLAQLDALVTDADLPHAARHPDFGRVTLRQLLSTWAVHDLNHVGQIVKTMAKQCREAVGPWREYLPILDAD